VSPPEVSSRQIEVRELRPEELPWVRELAVRAVIHGIPGSRDIPTAEVQRRADQAFGDLEFAFRTDPGFRILVATDANRLLGYLMLDLDHREASTGETQALIRDLAIEPAARGSRAVYVLVRQAARLAYRHGLRYLVGEVTAANRRPLVVAQRLGFVIERHQIAVQCGPEGLLPMPGRPGPESCRE
jgi:L-amino acid N-acyltransferase YncA